jgi:hypothetical protein
MKLTEKKPLVLRLDLPIKYSKNLMIHPERVLVLRNKHLFFAINYLELTLFLYKISNKNNGS